jgi:hypothetical protein
MHLHIYMHIFEELEDEMKGYIHDAQAIQKVFINALVIEFGCDVCSGFGPESILRCGVDGCNTGVLLVKFS